MRRCRLVSCAFVIFLGLGCSRSSEPAQGGADHPHEDGQKHGPHDGVLAALAGGAGHAEIKLHDDKGDLEVWLAEDEKITRPIDLPLDTELSVTFADKGGKVATLKVRNTTHNEDEDGTPNIREARTNYFIYPGQGGESSDWLKGKGFRSKARLAFTREGKTIESAEFELTPHHH